MIAHRTIRCLTLIAFLLCTGKAFAQPAVWHRANSPNIVQVSGYDQITFFGDSVLATQGQALVLSTDDGAKWQQINLLPSSADQLVIAGDLLFVHETIKRGIYRSSDRGRSLTLIDSGLRGYDVRDLVVSDTFLVGICSSGPIVRLGLHSDVWEFLSRPDVSDEPDPLCAAGSTVFCTTHNGVYRSLDHGATWQLTSHPAVRASFLAAQRSWIYSLVRYSTNDNGLWRSTDSGSTWVRLDSNLVKFFPVTQLESDGSALVMLADSLYVSGDTAQPMRGYSFFPGLPAPGLTHVFVHDPVWLANFTDQGTFRSSDHGSSWMQVGSVVQTTTPVDYIHAMASSSDTLFASAYTPSGVFVSTDGSKSWTYLGERTLHVRSLLAAQGQVVVGSTEGCAHLDIATNQWGTVPMNMGSVFSLTEFDGSIFAGADSGVWRSDDGGASYQLVNNGLGGPEHYSVYSFASLGEKLFAGAFDLFGSYGGVFMTTDKGGTWTNVGLPSISIYSMLRSDNMLLAATVDSGMYRSLDSGRTWQEVGMRHFYFTGLAEGLGKLFAATLDSGVFVSGDRGVTWLPYDSNLGSLHIERLQRLGDTLFASTYDDGLYFLPMANVQGVALATGSRAIDDVIVTPDPARTQIIVRIDPDTDNGLLIDDDLGRTVIRLSAVEVRAATGEVTIDVSSLPTGTYRLNVVGPHQRSGSFLVVR